MRQGRGCQFTAITVVPSGVEIGTKKHNVGAYGSCEAAYVARKPPAHNSVVYVLTSNRHHRCHKTGIVTYKQDRYA